MDERTKAKTCTKCGETKPLTEYGVATKVKTDGRKAECRSCQSAASADHYAQRKSEIRPRAPFHPRPCSLCGVVYDETGYYANNRCRDGYERRCKKCHNARSNASRRKRVEELGGYAALHDPVKRRQSEAKYRQKNPERFRAAQRRFKYGITADEYAEMVEASKGLCAICRKPMKRPCIDHCHETGKVRGLLCHNCNVGIGNLRDDPDIMRAAIRYLTS